MIIFTSIWEQINCKDHGTSVAITIILISQNYQKGTFVGLSIVYRRTCKREQN